MSSKFIKITNIGLPILLGGGLLMLVYHQTSPEMRSSIFQNIEEANFFWVSLSLILGILSHWARAARWKLMLLPMGYKTNSFTNFLMIMAAYLTNLGIPRSGEFLRATALAKYQGVPFEKGFGTIISERVIDLLMLLSVILIALILQTSTIVGYLNQYGNGLLFAIVFLIICFIGLFLTLTLLKKTKNSFLLKINSFLIGIREGILSLKKLDNQLLFWGYTVLIWGCYLAMFWVVKYAVPEVWMLSAGGIMVAFVAGAFAMMIFPGGFGGYPIFVGAALTTFGIMPENANAFGWIMWISQTLLVVLLGAISFVLLPLIYPKR